MTPQSSSKKIKQKEAEIARLAPGCPTEEKLKLTIAAVQELHTPERVQHSMTPTAASALRKLDDSQSQEVLSRPGIQPPV